MKRTVAVSVNEFFNKHPSYYYLERDWHFDVECTRLDSDLGYFKDKFTLELEGTAENIQLFLNYLCCNGFKIK